MNEKRDSLGRRRKPSQGGAGPKPLPDKNAIGAGVFDKLPPRGEHAKPWLEMWTWVVDQLDLMGVLDAADRAVILLTCDTFLEYTDAAAEIREHGKTIINSNVNGQTYSRNPHYVTREKCRAHLHSLYSTLGLTPSARAKFGTVGGEENDPFADLLNN